MSHRLCPDRTISHRRKANIVPKVLGMKALTGASLDASGIQADDLRVVTRNESYDPSDQDRHDMCQYLRVVRSIHTPIHTDMSGNGLWRYSSGSVEILADRQCTPVPSYEQINQTSFMYNINANGVLNSDQTAQGPIFLEHSM